MGMIRRGLGAIGMVGLLCIPVLMGARSKRPGANLIRNGNFQKRLTKNKEIPGWHTRLTGIIPVPEYKDPARKKGRTGVVRFKCGCGRNWGTVRPWSMLVCPKCGHMNPGLEDSGSMYQKNHESVSLVKDGRDKAVRLQLSPSVGNNQGVRVISNLIRAERGAGYEISFDALSNGTAVLRVFVECFRVETDDEKAKQWAKDLPAKANPLKLTMRLKRVFRKQVNPGSPKQWQRFSEKLVPPKRYQFDYMFVTLYAFMPGEAQYDDVVLRKLTQRELEEYVRSRRKYKDKRFRGK